MSEISHLNEVCIVRHLERDWTIVYFDRRGYGREYFVRDDRQGMIGPFSEPEYGIEWVKAIRPAKGLGI